ncbi:MAG TPA: thiamine phosphate synthase [Burkholderiales bacterium]|nr:thiamine phosphate synthase [Burkholderiales bacterium]
MKKTVSGLYAVTPDLSDSELLSEKVAEALAGGARAVQYRSKSGDESLRRHQAAGIAQLCRERRATFIVNDSVELAREVGADGVHLGRNDEDVARARAVLGTDKIIGVSCYNEIERARIASFHGADYVAFGSFFPSATKPGAVRADIGLLRVASAEIALPIVAIGGIDADNAAELIRAGADAIAVVSALFDVPDSRAQAHRLARLFE